MSEDLPTDTVDLAEEYLENLDGGEGAEGDPEEAREEIKYWEEQVDEFEEGTAIHEMAVEERDEWRERLEAIDAQDKRREDLRNELLARGSTEFAPRGEWLEPAVIEGLTHALLGQRQEQIYIDQFSLPRDADELSKREMVDIAKTVQAVAGDAVGSDDRIDGLWDELSTDTRRSITGVLASHEGLLSADEIRDKLGEDGTDRPGSNIRKVRHAVDIQPYYSTTDGYTLTLAGSYVWAKYGPDTPEPDSEEDNADDVRVAAGDDREESEESSSVSAGEEETASVRSDTEGSEDTSKEVDLSSFKVRE